MLGLSLDVDNNDYVSDFVSRNPESSRNSNGNQAK